MADLNDRSFIGVAKIHARAHGTTDKLRWVGNVAQLNLAHQVQTIRQPNYYRPGGGSNKRRDRIEQVNLAFQWLSFVPSNMAIAVAGESAAVAASSATNESIRTYKGTLSRLAHPPATITAVTNVGGTVTHTVNTDYSLSAGGVLIPETSTIADSTGAVNAEVDYTYIDYTKIEGAVKSGTTLEIFYEGVNEGEQLEPTLIDFWKVYFGPAASLSLIGQEYGQMDLAAECLADTTKGVGGASSFYRIRQVNPIA